MLTSGGMSTEVRTYTPEAAVRYPLLPASYETGWRYMFDWTVAGQALACGPGDRVLEFAAGSGYASELLNRLSDTAP